MHHAPPTRAQLRWFGLLWLPLMLAAITYTLVRRGVDVAVWITSPIAALSMLLGGVRPEWLAPVFVGLRALTAPIGFVVSRTLLAAVYWLILTPIALIVRAVRRSPLDTTLDRTRESYWTPPTTTRDTASYFRQY